MPRYAGASYRWTRLEIHVLIDFAFKSVLLSAVANVAFGFVARAWPKSSPAHRIYGSARCSTS
jgi:hypothetical protein